MLKKIVSAKQRCEHPRQIRRLLKKTYKQYRVPRASRLEKGEGRKKLFFKKKTKGCSVM